MLYRQGVITRAQLDHLLQAITPDKRFGQLCIESGLMAQEELFKHLQKQAEQIFFATLLVSEGAYTFTTIDDAAPPPTHTVHMVVQGLLMEGVQAHRRDGALPGAHSQ